MRLQKNYYKLWYVESEQTLARSIAIVIFIRVRFKQRSCMARYVDELKKYGDHRAGVRAGTLCEIVKRRWSIISNSINLKKFIVFKRD